MRLQKRCVRFCVLPFVLSLHRTTRELSRRMPSSMFLRMMRRKFDPYSWWLPLTFVAGFRAPFLTPNPRRTAPPPHCSLFRRAATLVHARATSHALKKRVRQLSLLPKNETAEVVVQEIPCAANEQYVFFVLNLDFFCLTHTL